VAALQRRHTIAGAIFRLGSTPLLPWATRHVLGIPVLLKGLGLYASFGNDPEMRESRSTGARRAGTVGRFFAPVYRSLVREVPIADTVSDVYAEWLHHTFGIPRDRILVIPNGANVQVFSPGDTAAARRELGLDRFDYVVGYVGSLTTIRHVDLLVRSISALAPASNVGLVLVGDGKDRANLQSLATELGVQDRVIFVGSVPYRRVPSYVRAFDVAADLTLVTMRIGDRILRTSYSQKIPQYLACGVPVVAWDVDGTHFLSSQRIGAVARVTDLASLIDAFRRLIDMGDPERREMRRRAREFAESHLAVDRLASQRVEAWRSALSELRV
jgi:glycosyltransferase involved in cell wall biosynthesis